MSEPKPPARDRPGTRESVAGPGAAASAATPGSIEAAPIEPAPIEPAPIEPAPIEPAPTTPVPTPPVTPVVRPATKGRVSGGTVAVVLAAIVAVGGLAFAAGRVTAPATTVRPGGGGFPVASGRPLPSGGQLPAGIGGAFGGVTISGTVTAVGDGELTIKTNSGTEVTIPVDDTTAYHSQAAASSSDVTSGTSVEVQVTMGRGQGPQGSLGALPSPGAGGPGTGGQMTFGTAADVTIVED